MSPAFLPSPSCFRIRPALWCVNPTVTSASPCMRSDVPPAARRPRCTVPAAAAGVAAAALLTLHPTSMPAPPLRADPLSSSPVAVAATPGLDMNEKALRERSRRNSRVSGASAQLYATAKREAQVGNFPAALDSYNKLVEVEPNFAPARSNRANVLVAQGKLAASIPDYTAALELAPVESDVWVVLVNRGCVYLALGQEQSALDDFNAALARGNGDATAIYSNRAACFERQEKWDRALRDYQRAIEANASDVQPWWVRYALVLFEEGRSADAVGILKRVAARYDASDVHAALAGVLFARGNIVEAEGQWSLVDRPKSFASREFLEKDRKWTPRLVQAMEEFSMARKARPTASAAPN